MKLRYSFKSLIHVAILLLLFSSCSHEETEQIKPDDLSVLAPDSGGEHKAELLDPAKNIYGHYTYLPGGYKADGPAYPLIIFLHGMGERGNSQSNPDALKKILVTGLPKLIEKKNFKPAHPAIVVSPQCHDDWWNDQKIHDHITYILQKYNINKSRVYITGLSMGGYGTFNYVEKFGDNGYAAAALPVAGGGNLKNLDGFKNIPVWAFHGDADKTVTPDKSTGMIAAINAQNPLHKAKVTIYPGVAHFSWDMTYDGTGMGKESKDYDPFSEDIYSWMFKYKKE